MTELDSLYNGLIHTVSLLFLPGGAGGVIHRSQEISKTQVYFINKATCQLCVGCR